MQSDISERKRQAATGQGPGMSFQSPAPHPHAKLPHTPIPTTSQQVPSPQEPSRHAVPRVFTRGLVQGHLCLGKVPDPQRKWCLDGRSLILQRCLGAARPSPPRGHCGPSGTPAPGQPHRWPSRAGWQLSRGGGGGQAGLSVNPLLHSRWKTAPVKERSEKTSRYKHRVNDFSCRTTHTCSQDTGLEDPLSAPFMSVKRLKFLLPFIKKKRGTGETDTLNTQTVSGGRHSGGSELLCILPSGTHELSVLTPLTHPRIVNDLSDAEKSQMNMRG